MLKRKGQSILEYVIVLTAIVAAIAGILLTNFQKDETKGLGKLFKKSADKITTESKKIVDMVP